MIKTQLFGMKKGLFLDLSQISANKHIEVKDSNKDGIVQVTEGLFVSGVKSANNLGVLRRKGIDLIVNLVSRFQENEFPEEFEYLSYDLRDSAYSDIIAELHELADKLNDRIQRGDKVLVHCKKGISRSPSVAIAYLIKHKGMDFDSALALLQAKSERVFPNAGFLIQLKTL